MKFYQIPISKKKFKRPITIKRIKRKMNIYQATINNETITFPAYTCSEYRAILKKHINGPIPVGLKINKI